MTRDRGPYRRRSAAALVCLLLAAAPVRAQTLAAEPTISAVGGAWQYDLSGTGTSWFAGLRAALPLTGPLLLEPGVTYARYTTQGDTDVNLLFPELQVQLEIVRRRLRPYVGIGAGPAFAWADGASETDLALTASAGLRARVSPLWGALGELRIRSIDPWTGSAAEWTVGVSRHL